MPKKSKKGLDYQDAVNEYIGAMDGVGVGVDGEDGNLADTYSIESKNTQTASIRAFMRQAETQAEGKVPVVVLADFHPGSKTRRAMGQSLVTMRLDDWLEMAHRNGDGQMTTFLNDDLLVWAGRNGAMAVSVFGSGQINIMPCSPSMIEVSVDKGEGE